MRRTALVTAALAAVLAVSAAIAAPPPGKGSEKAQEKAAGAAAKAQEKAAAKAAKATSCKPKVAFVLKGTYVSGSADASGVGSFAMQVTKANKHGRAFAGKQATIKTDASTKIRRAGKATLADLKAGDRLNVHVRGCKGADPATLELVAKRVVAKRPGGEAGTTTGTTTTGTTTTGTTTTGTTTTGTTGTTTTTTTGTTTTTTP
jgi:hypothetical protein